eukprot:901355-Rhodomonas_salina.2
MRATSEAEAAVGFRVVPGSLFQSSLCSEFLHHHERRRGLASALVALVDPLVVVARPLLARERMRVRENRLLLLHAFLVPRIAGDADASAWLQRSLGCGDRL